MDFKQRAKLAEQPHPAAGYQAHTKRLDQSAKYGNCCPEQKTERLATQEDTEAQRREVALLRELLEEVRGERDNLRADRDRWQQQAERITLLLTHQPPAAETTRPGLWRRLFGG